SASSAGGLFSFGGATITGSTFDSNTATLGNAAVQAVGSATIANSTFTHNRVSSVGGGTPNVAAGAVFMGGGSVTQSTFLDNSTPDPTSGQAISTNVPLTLVGNIFASSTPTKSQLATVNPGMVTDGGGNVFSTSAALETGLAAASSTSKFGASVASL